MSTTQEPTEGTSGLAGGAAPSSTATTAGSTTAGSTTAGAAADDIKKRAELAAKSLGGLGTTLLGGTGLAKFSDIWPWPPGTCSWLALGVILLGFAAMGFAVGGYASRLWNVNEPIIWRSDRDLILGLRGDEEKKIVGRVYNEMAQLNDVESLRAYEARSKRWQRIGLYLPAPLADVLAKRAEQINKEISVTHQRTYLRVVQRRINNALTDTFAKCLYFSFIAGLMVFALGVDYLQGERADGIATAKSCADAATAGASDLPAICGESSPSPTPTPPPTTREEAAGALGALSASLMSCEKAAAAGQGSSVHCRSIVHAIETAATDL